MIPHVREESFLFHFEIEIYLNFSIVIYSRTVIYGLNFFPTITFGHISYSRFPFFPSHPTSYSFFFLNKKVPKKISATTKSKKDTVPFVLANYEYLL